MRSHIRRTTRGQSVALCISGEGSSWHWAQYRATSWAPGVQVFGEWQYRKILAVGLDLAYSRMETELTFSEGVQTGDLDYYEYGVNAKLGIPTRGRIWPYATLALHRTINKADFELDGLSDHRVHHTRRDGLGAGFDYNAGPNWGVRVDQDWREPLRNWVADLPCDAWFLRHSSESALLYAAGWNS